MNEAQPPAFALSGRKILALSLGAIVVLLGTSVILAAALYFLGTPSKSLSPSLYLIVLLVLPFGALLAWIYGFTVRMSTGVDRWLGLKELTGIKALAGIAAGFASAAISWFIIMLVRPWLGEPFNFFVEISDRTGTFSAPNIIILLFFGSVLAPLAEEILFRGALYTWFRTRLSVFAAAAVVAILHTLPHVDPAVMPALFAVFFWYGLIYEWSGNLWVPILAHATNNTLAFILVYIGMA